jgi:hypothetical protein
VSYAFILCFNIPCFLHFGFGSKVSANETLFSFCYIDLSYLLLSISRILLPKFVTQLPNNFYILKYVILLLNIFAKYFLQPSFQL